MERVGSGQTTLPSRAGARPGATRSAAAIRWVFPEAGLLRLGGDRLLLGRGEDADFVLFGRETSRHHAELVRDGPIWVLRDLGSRNGVVRNGTREAEGPICDGDVLRLGEWVGVVGPFETPRNVEIAPGLWGSERLTQAVEPARRSARSELPVVVQGATGTGKERVAHAIHGWSERSGDFVAVNCAALPESLAEAELFGYKKGAFTGATRDSPGYFRAAHEGTLLLDEVVDLPAPLQAKLLRVIELGEVVPLGDTRPVAASARLVIAAQSSLREAVAEKRFRADLLARLEGVCVELPPLAERREDVAGLFLSELSRRAGGNPPRVDPRLIEQLCLHDWPYNVRELVQLARRLLALHAAVPELGLEHLRSELRRENAEAPASSSAKGPGSRRDRHQAALFERLSAALGRYAGNVSKAASAVGITRQRAYRLLKQNPDTDLDALRFPEPPEEGG